MSEPDLARWGTDSPPYREYERLLRALHELDASGRLDSPEADMLRDRMDMPWRSLSPKAQARLAALSEDLFADRGENGAAGGAEFVARAVVAARTAYESHQWDELLLALRTAQSAFPPAVVAYMRGRAWSELGDPFAGTVFFANAFKLDPTNQRYRLLELHTRFQVDPVEATREADELLANAEVHPELAIGAAKVLIDAARGQSLPGAAALYRRVVTALPSAMKNAASLLTGPIPSLGQAGYLSLGIAYERLGEREAAQRVYDTAVATYPSADGPLLARAMFLLAFDEASAYRDMQALVDRNTSFPYPFLFLAGHTLGQQNFRSCIDLCARGVERASSDRVVANLLEWIAIASHELGAPEGQVRDLFQNALRLDPMNDRIRRNYLAQERHTQNVRTLSNFVIEPSIAAQEVASEIHGRLGAAA